VLRGVGWAHGSPPGGPTGPHPVGSGGPTRWAHGSAPGGPRVPSRWPTGPHPVGSGVPTRWAHGSPPGGPTGPHPVAHGSPPGAVCRSPRHQTITSCSGLRMSSAWNGISKCPQHEYAPSVLEPRTCRLRSTSDAVNTAGLVLASAA
jgi:hypothetical protein